MQAGAGTQAHQAVSWFSAFQWLHLVSALGCSKRTSAVSAHSDLIFSLPGLFPLWFYTGGVALGSRGLSRRHGETCRNQEGSRFGWTGVMLATPDILSLCPASVSKSQQQSAKRQQAGAAQLGTAVCWNLFAHSL